MGRDQPSEGPKGRRDQARCGPNCLGNTRSQDALQPKPAPPLPLPDPPPMVRGDVRVDLATGFIVVPSLEESPQPAPAPDDAVDRPAWIAPEVRQKTLGLFVRPVSSSPDPRKESNREAGTRGGPDTSPDIARPAKRG